MTSVCECSDIGAATEGATSSLPSSGRLQCSAEQHSTTGFLMEISLQNWNNNAKRKRMKKCSRVSRRLAPWPGVDAGRGPGRGESSGVLEEGGAWRGLGVRAQLLVAGQIAGCVAGRTAEPIARLGQDLLLLPAVVANPDHLRSENTSDSAESNPSGLFLFLKFNGSSQYSVNFHKQSSPTVWALLIRIITNIHI